MRTVLAATLAMLGAASIGPPPTADQTRPRLLFSADDLPRLRENTRKPGVAAKAWRVMLDKAEVLMTVKTDPYYFHGSVAGRALTIQTLTLAMAGHVGGESRYLDKARAILCAAARQSDVQDIAARNSALAVGDALHGYAIGYDWLWPCMSPDERSLIRDEVEQFGAWLYENSQTEFWGQDEPRRMAHNWNGLTHGALGLAALTLGDREQWLSRAIERVRGYLRYSHDETGAAYEGVTYMAYGLQNVVPMAEALRRTGGPDLLDEYPAIRKIPHYLLWQVLPTGGAVVPINQCGGNLKPAGGVLHLTTKFRDAVGLWGWLWTQGERGDGSYGTSSWLGSGASLPYVVLWADPELAPMAPEQAGLPLSALFARGQASLRDGWGPADTLVTFTCGKGINGIWNQGDESSFTFYSRGERFAVDPGPTWGKTGEHNAMLIDGLGQAAEGGPRAVQGRIDTFEDMGDAVHVLGDATEAYRTRQPMAHARRHLLFGRGPQPYLLIVDNFQKDEHEHEFTWLMHSAEGNRVELDPQNGRARVVGGQNNAVCEVRFLAPSEGLKISASVAREKLPVLRADVTAVNPMLVTLLVALRPDEAAPQVACLGGADGLEVSIIFSTGRRDLIRLKEGTLSFERQG